MRRKNAIHEIFMKNTFQKKEFSSSSTSYGKANEIIAKQMYIRNTGNHLHEVGLIVNPGFPFLGATPDGIMSDKSTTAIIEMKCSYAVRDMCICEACELRNYFFLKKNDDLFSLKHSHAHWYQIQGQLLIWLPWSENCLSSTYITLSAK